MFALDVGSQPGEQAAGVLGQALSRLRGLHNAQRDIELLEGAHLEFLLRSGSYREYGFAGFGDFLREVLQISERTARRQIALHRLVLISPEIAQALSEGRITACQALALQPLAGKENLEPWLILGETCSVADLQRAVFEHTNAESLPDEESGRFIRFSAPSSAALAWDHGVDWARRMLGWHAPKFMCVDAILSEASSVWMSLENEAVEVEVGGTLKKPAENAYASGSQSKLMEEPPVLSPDSIAGLMTCLAEAERLLALVAKHAESPQWGPASVRILLSTKLTGRSLRILFVRLLKEIHRAGFLTWTGHGTPRKFLVSEFKFSERTAARLLSEGWLFEESPMLLDAFRQGRIGLGQAYLIDRVASGSTINSFIQRAMSVTHLHFEREIHFLERLRDYLPDFGRRFPGPLPAPELESALMGGLLAIGWTNEKIEAELREYSPYSRRELGQDHEEDPAINTLILRRLEALL